MQQGNMLGALMPLIILFAIFYFLILRPQKKAQEAHKKMIDELQKGDKIITTGGIIATVVKNEESFLKVKISDDFMVKLYRTFVSKNVDVGEKA